jgi:hypothetical protein
MTQSLPPAAAQAAAGEVREAVDQCAEPRRNAIVPGDAGTRLRVAMSGGVMYTHLMPLSIFHIFHYELFIRNTLSGV